MIRPSLVSIADRLDVPPAFPRHGDRRQAQFLVVGVEILSTQRRGFLLVNVGGEGDGW
jgi:hypothetical protein